MNNIVVAITGASGAPYAKLLLEKLMTLQDQWQQLSVVCSSNAATVWEAEIAEENLSAFLKKNDRIRLYTNTDFSAPFASGSGNYQTMIIIPCSMGTLGRIAGGISNDLITRAADVILKERRKLICVARETPYNIIHIKNMEAVTAAGGIVCPATPSFYSRPQTIEEVLATVVDRIIDLADLKQSSYRWGN
jgi:4-hydroxy-3-polyprenylbenzoate decarboxylase